MLHEELFCVNKKKFMLDKKKCFLSTKTRDTAHKNYFVPKKVIIFFGNGALYINVLKSYNYIKLYFVKLRHLQKLTNQSMLNGALVIKMVNNSFSESKRNFGRLIKRETP